MAETGSVQSIQRCFLLLEALSLHPQGVAVKELAEGQGLPKSTVHRLLATLVAMGYAAQNPQTGLYRATTRLYEVGSRVISGIDVVNAARAPLEQLAVEVQETVHLVVRDGAEVVYVHKAEAGPMSMSSRLGMRLPMYCSGVGKAIMAALPYAQAKQVWDASDIQPRTPSTILDFAAMEKQLAKARKNGWAIDDEENERGICCIAFALPQPGGAVNAAFSISGMKTRMDKARLAQLAEAGRRTRQQILWGL